MERRRGEGSVIDYARPSAMGVVESGECLVVIVSPSSANQTACGFTGV